MSIITIILWLLSCFIEPEIGTALTCLPDDITGIVCWETP